MSSAKADAAFPESRRAEGLLRPRPLDTYHVFVASPGDVGDERREVRAFFEAYNRNHAAPRGLRFEVIDWENHSSAGVGRPQELITEQTLERYKDSLALVIGIMAQRFGSPSGTHESGTEEEFEWALTNQRDRQFPAVKWFFRDIPQVHLRPDHEEEDLAQWKKVKAFRARVEAEKLIFAKPFADHPAFQRLLESDVAQWLARPERPWFGRHVSVEVGAARSADWPESVLMELAARWDDEFMRHMRGGEVLSSSEARKRYVPGLLRRRGGVASVEAAKATGQQKELTEGRLEDFAAQPHARLLVLGPGGRGKTTTLRYLAAESARRALADPTAPVCIYSSLTTFDAADGGFEALARRLAVAAGLGRDEFDQRWRSGPRPILFLLDALNEVSRAHIDSCTKALLGLLQGGHASHRYVISARSGTEFESLSSKAGEDVRVDMLELLEFGPEQVRAYLQAQGRSELQQVIGDSLEGIASNPFLLWAITRVYTAASSKERPKNRGALFQALIDQYIFEQREQSKPRPRPTKYHFELVKKPVLAALAAAMLDDGVTQIEDGDDWRGKIRDQLKALAAKHEHVYPLEDEVFMPAQFASTSLIGELLDNGVLVREGKHLRFMHESVQEYFAAVAFNDKPIESPIEALLRRAPAINLARPDARGSMFETLVTWAGIAKPERVRELVRQLDEKHPILAVHLYQEAGLNSEFEADAKRRFLGMMKSEHEARAALGVKGLALVDSGDPEIVEALLAALDGPLASAAERALTRSDQNVLRALIESCLTAPPTSRPPACTVLEDSVRTHGRDVATAFSHACDSGTVDPTALAELAVFVDRGRFGNEGRLDTSLIELSVDAHLRGEQEFGGSIDALRQRMSQVEPPERFSWSREVDEAPEQAQETVLKLEAFRSTCRTADERELTSHAATLDFERWHVVRDELARRSAADDPILAAAVSAVIAGAPGSWLSELERLSRDRVEREFLRQLVSVPEGQRERARQLAELFAPQPTASTLRSIFSQSSHETREFAARAAARAGPDGVDCLVALLRQEQKENVILAALEALGRIGTKPARTHLNEVLLDASIRSHWAPPANTVSSLDEDLDLGVYSLRILDILAEIGAVGETLEVLAAAFDTSTSKEQLRYVIIAGRRAKEPHALALLWRGARSEASGLRRASQLHLACAGETAVWRALLECRLRGPADGAWLASRAPDLLERAALCAKTRELLLAAARSVLQPALLDSNPTLRLRAATLARTLPRSWIDDAWRVECLSVSESLVQSEHELLHQEAVDNIAAFTLRRESQLLDLLFDPHEKVRDEARRLLEYSAVEQLVPRLDQAVAAGDLAGAAQLARALGRDAFRRCSAMIEHWLSNGGPTQSAAALIAASRMWLHYLSEPEETAWARRLRATFERLNAEALWDEYASDLSETADPVQQDFTLSIVRAFWDQLAWRQRILAHLIDLWPHHLEVHELAVYIDVELGDTPAASERLNTLQNRFGDLVSPLWMGNAFLTLGRRCEAISAYRRALEQSPDDAEVHSNMGWAAFLAGELDQCVEASQHALSLRPVFPEAAFNLALAHLARGEQALAEKAYARGAAITRRYEPTTARKVLDSVLADFPLLAAYPASAPAAESMLHRLQTERDRLGTPSPSPADPQIPNSSSHSATVGLGATSTTE